MKPKTLEQYEQEGRLIATTKNNGTLVIDGLTVIDVVFKEGEDHPHCPCRFHNSK